MSVVNKFTDKQAASNAISPCNFIIMIVLNRASKNALPLNTLSEIKNNLNTVGMLCPNQKEMV